MSAPLRLVGVEIASSYQESPITAMIRLQISGTNGRSAPSLWGWTMPSVPLGTCHVRSCTVCTVDIGSALPGVEILEQYTQSLLYCTVLYWPAGIATPSLSWQAAIHFSSTFVLHVADSTYDILKRVGVSDFKIRPLPPGFGCCG